MLRAPDTFMALLSNAVSSQVADIITREGNGKIAWWAIKTSPIVQEEQLEAFRAGVKRLCHTNVQPRTLDDVLAAATASRIRVHLADPEYGRVHKALTSGSDRSAILMAEKESLNPPAVHMAKAMWMADQSSIRVDTWMKAGEAGIPLMVRGQKPQELKGFQISQDEEYPLVLMWYLFGTADRVKSYVKRSGRSLHDAGQLRLPKADAVWDKDAWANLCIRAPSVTRMLSIAPEIEKALGQPPLTKEEAEEGLKAWADQPGNSLVATLMMSGVILSDDEMEDYQEEMEKPSPQKVIPHLHSTDGEYTIATLVAGDPDLLLAGLHSDCCQHLHGDASEIASQCWTAPEITITGLYKGDVMVAQAATWVTEDNGIVFDSIESKGSASSEMGVKMFLTMAKLLKEAGYGPVYMGHSRSSIGRSIPAGKSIDRPKGANGFTPAYGDSRTVTEILTD